MTGPRILVVRLGAMGDVIQALPAVASLKHSFPHSHLCWVVSHKWAPLLEGNSFLDQVILFDRRTVRGLTEVWRKLRSRRWSFAVDFQGLTQSALVATAARPERIFGFQQRLTDERPAALFYSNRAAAHAVHMVDQNLELASAAGASSLLKTFPIPGGAQEGDLPKGKFVLTSPLGGWTGKQWPLENYSDLARRLEREGGLTLVVSGPPESEAMLSRIAGAHVHCSTLPGLIWATRRAEAIVGIDSGPLHLAAALGKPGVAVYGPTNPARNGPYGDTITVLRDPDARTTYKRHAEIDGHMRAISPTEVFEALKVRLALKAESAAAPL